LGLWTSGGTMLIYLAGLQGIPVHLYEAAMIDGANWWHKFWHVTIPMLSPTIFFNLIIGLIGTFQYFTEAYIMTTGNSGGSNDIPGGPLNSTMFYSIYLFQNGFAYFKMGYASAMAWILFLIVLAATLLIFKTSARWVYYEGAH
jgi:multiple sugar transport system permease protein